MSKRKAAGQAAEGEPEKGSGRGNRRGRRRMRLIGFGLLALLLVLCSALSSSLCPCDPYAQDLSQSLQPPSALHLFGTDIYGRDVLSRVIAGSRSSILSALLLAAVSAALGTLVGICCGWYGRWIDAVLMRISDLFLAFPGLVLALAVAGALGGGLRNAVIALALISWPKYARIARSQTLAQKSLPYLKAAKLAGCSGRSLMQRHLLPNILGPILVTAMLDIGTMMMELAGLSFLGLGARAPMAEWGSMMSISRSMLQTAPWLTLAPGLAIFLSVMIFNLLGDSVRDFLDPRQ